MKVACPVRRGALENLSVSRPTRRPVSIPIYPRVSGWQVSEPIRRQFQAFARVARSVPVFEAEIPWGPPFAPELPTALLRGVGFDGRLMEVPT